MTAMTARQFLKAMDEGTIDFKHDKCIGCGGDIRAITGRHKVLGGFMDDDCYYEALGAIVEKHPIVTAGIRRS